MSEIVYNSAGFTITQKAYDLTSSENIALRQRMIIYDEFITLLESELDKFRNALRTVTAAEYLTQRTGGYPQVT